MNERLILTLHHEGTRKGCGSDEPGVVAGIDEGRPLADRNQAAHRAPRRAFCATAAFLGPLCLLFACLPASAQAPPSRGEKAVAERRIQEWVERDFDIRQSQQARPSATAPAPRTWQDQELVRQRKAQLKTYRATAKAAGRRGLRIAVNAFGLPKSLSNAVEPLSAPSAEDPVTIAKHYLRAHRNLFLLNENDIETLRLAGKDASAAGMTFLHFNQTVNGVDVYQGQVKITLNGAGQVIQAGAGDLVPRLRIDTRPALSEREAVLAAFRFLGLDPPSELQPLPSRQARHAHFRNPAGEQHNPIRVQLAVFPLTPTSARLAYRLFVEAETTRSYEMLIDARDGGLLLRRNLTLSVGQARVWRKSPLAGDRERVDFPDGWIPPDGTVTTGNNADAFLDEDGDGTPDSEALEDLPDIESGRASSAAQLFDFPAPEGVTGANPRDFPAAAVTNLFYLVNAAHDYFYDLGFTEQAGNYQTDNFGRGGEEHDAMRAMAWGVPDNAFYVPSPDGFPGTIGMGIFSQGTATEDDDRDSAYSAQAVFHEYAHGVSTRIVGGPYDILCLVGLQSAGLGEGWSDYFSNSYTDDPVQGAYLSGNGEHGIRRQSYEGYPFTYEDFGNEGFDSPHDEGEIWAAALWDLRKELGQNVADRLVMDGLKLTPCSPSMIDARGGVIAALEADAATDAADRAAAWEVFARHGMGYSASGFESLAATTYNAAFDLPPDLQPGNRNPVISSRPPYFRPSFGKDYVYAIEASDPDGDELRYELTAGPTRMTVDPVTGVLRWMTGFTNQRIKITVSDGAGGRIIHGFPLVPQTRLMPDQAITIEGEAASLGSAFMEVPPDMPVLQVTLRGGSGNPDLFLMEPFGFFPKVSMEPGATETISVSAPRAGVWDIVVSAGDATAYAGVSLEASLPVPALIGEDTQLPNLSGEETSETFYRVSIPPGTFSFRVSTDGGSGDVDLYVNRGRPAVCSGPSELRLFQCVFDESSAHPGNAEFIGIDKPEPGDWYIALAASEAYSGVTLTTAGLSSFEALFTPPPRESP